MTFRQRFDQTGLLGCQEYFNLIKFNVIKGYIILLLNK